MKNAIERPFFRWLGLGLFGLIVANALGAGLTASHTNFLPELCLFRRLFDVACPGCGMTRAMISLSNLEFARALALNPLSLPLAGCGLYVCASELMREGAEIRDHALYDVEADHCVRLEGATFRKH